MLATKDSSFFLTGFSNFWLHSRRRTIAIFLAILTACLVLTQKSRLQDSLSTDSWTASNSHRYNLVLDNDGDHKSSGTTSPSTIAAVTMLYGKSESDRIYQRAYRTHKNYAAIHGYPTYTLKRPLADGYWSKTYYLLSLVLQELEKDPAEQVEWFAWFDGDTIIMNPSLPMETFLPPFQRDFKHIHMLATNDRNGLNSGIMILRVSQWTVEFLSASLAYLKYNPKADLGASYDQKAMENLLKTPEFIHNATFVPKHWFNPDVGECKPGDLLVHFPGLGDRDWHMQYWLRRAEGVEKEQWDIPVAQLQIKQEVEQFWDSVQKGEAGKAD